MSLASLAFPLARPLLHALDAETAHGLTLRALTMLPRGGSLFPHVYGVIETAAARWVKPLPFVDGTHVFPPDVAE